jgi:hemerythrin-like domain-containing protein
VDDTFDVLEQQHCALLARLDATAEQLAALTLPLLDLLTYLEGDVGAHFTLEERALFPILARHPELAAGPLPVMEEEHASFRALLGRLGDALRHGTVASQVGVVESLIDLLRAHIAKEDTVLFALARLTLTPEERGEVERLARASK